MYYTDMMRFLSFFVVTESLLDANDNQSLHQTLVIEVLTPKGTTYDAYTEHVESRYVVALNMNGVAVF